MNLKDLEFIIPPYEHVQLIFNDDSSYEDDWINIKFSSPDVEVVSIRSLDYYLQIEVKDHESKSE